MTPTSANEGKINSLAEWSTDNINKTKELITDLRKMEAKTPSHVYINGAEEKQANGWVTGRFFREPAVVIIHTHPVKEGTERTALLKETSVSGQNPQGKFLLSTDEQ